MRKKALTVALVAVMLTLLVSGTLAFFTDEDTVKNTVEFGSVEIEIYENGEKTTSDTVAFGRLIPVVKSIPSEDKNYFDKVVTVKSVGENAAYIRVHIAIPTALVGYLIPELSTTGWEQVFQTEGVKDGVAYTVYTYDYVEKVQPDNFTAELLRGVYLASDADARDNPATASADLEFCKPNGDGTYTFSGFTAHTKTANGYATNTVCILVAAAAMQDRGFDDPTTALNAGFGANTNPWQ